jgi:hypothetical protein
MTGILNTRVNQVRITFERRPTHFRMLLVAILIIINTLCCNLILPLQPFKCIKYILMQERSPSKLNSYIGFMNSYVVCIRFDFINTLLPSFIQPDPVFTLVHRQSRSFNPGIVAQFENHTPRVNDVKVVNLLVAT